MYNMILSHVRLDVCDLERATDFYTRLLHLDVVERVGEDCAFLSNDDRHHVLALWKVKAAPRGRETSAGVSHVAFQVPGKKSFAHAYQSLVEARIPVETVDNAISWSLYFDDPEGNPLEIFWDTRYEAHGDSLWRGTRRSLQPETILKALEEKSPYVVPEPSAP